MDGLARWAKMVGLARWAKDAGVHTAGHEVGLQRRRALIGGRQFVA
jgi:hypothetical protein